MSLSTKHPTYTPRAKQWGLMRVSYSGEDAVKARGTDFLPATEGMTKKGMSTGQPGLAIYDAYKTRAVFPDFVQSAVEGMVGVMHRKPPTIKLPKVMEPLMERATINGEGLATLLRQINEQQILMGRIGILADVATDAGPNVLPYISTYTTETIFNWDVSSETEDGIRELSLVVLDQRMPERVEQFAWKVVQKYLVLIDAKKSPGILDEGVTGYWSARVSEKESVTVPDFTQPSIAGKTLDKIPFVVIGPKDLVPDPDIPPMLSLGHLAMAVYRGEADHRHALYMQAQETLVLIGGENDIEHGIGAGGYINVPIGGDVKYVGVSGTGLSEMREKLKEDRSEAGSLGAKMIEEGGSTQQSGEALKVRVAARSATLSSVALAGAEGLKQILKQIATWIGANPDEVEVDPNMEFSDEDMSGDELNKLMTAKSAGAPLSLKSIHRIMQQGDLTDMSLEDELNEIDSEQPLGSLGAFDPQTGVALDPITGLPIVDPNIPQTKPAQKGEKVPPTQKVPKK
jgi:Domain of unknown function (DUF4055)